MVHYLIEVGIKGGHLQKLYSDKNVRLLVKAIEDVTGIIHVHFAF